MRQLCISMTYILRGGMHVRCYILRGWDACTLLYTEGWDVCMLVHTEGVGCMYAAIY